MSQSHLSVTFIAARTLRLCHSVLVSTMFIETRIFRDLVRYLVSDHVSDHFRAAHVRATLVSANSLTRIIYSSIHKMKTSLDPGFTGGGSEGEVDSTESPSELNTAGIYLSQPE
jgi:hypothetical protein